MARAEAEETWIETAVNQFRSMHLQFLGVSRLVRRTALAALLCLVPMFEAVGAEKVIGESGPHRTSLIELFTSEGCSSCPAAEAWLSQLRSQPGLWRDFVPVAFHVDYWDKRGWKDRFAQPFFTARQRAYAARWKRGAVYTPAFAINGIESKSPSLPRSSGAAGVLKIKRADDGQIVVTFSPADGSPEKWEAHVSFLGSGIDSKIGAGENSGRKLRHDFVVLDYERRGMEGGNGSLKATFSRPSKATGQGTRPAVAAWITAHGQMTPVQAAGGWL